MKPVNYSEMMQLFSASKAKEIVCFFDACFSGTIAQDVRSSDKDIVFFLSSRPDEMSQEDSGWIGAGYLTQALLKGIRGMADTDHNKEVTVMELFKYIYKDVTARVEKRNSNAPDDRYKVRQHPQLVAAKRSYNMVLTNGRHTKSVRQRNAPLRQKTAGFKQYGPKRLQNAVADA